MFQISVWDDTPRMWRAVVGFPVCWKDLKGSSLEMERLKQDILVAEPLHTLLHSTLPL